MTEKGPRRKLKVTKLKVTKLAVFGGAWGGD
jgi:hypothetical protein